MFMFISMYSRHVTSAVELLFFNGTTKKYFGTNFEQVVFHYLLYESIYEFLDSFRFVDLALQIKIFFPTLLTSS